MTPHETMRARLRSLLNALPDVRETDQTTSSGRDQIAFLCRGDEEIDALCAWVFHAPALVANLLGERVTGTVAATDGEDTCSAVAHVATPPPKEMPSMRPAVLTDDGFREVRAAIERVADAIEHAGQALSLVRRRREAGTLGGIPLPIETREFDIVLQIGRVFEEAWRTHAHGFAHLPRLRSAADSMDRTVAEILRFTAQRLEATT